MKSATVKIKKSIRNHSLNRNLLCQQARAILAGNNKKMKQLLLVILLAIASINSTRAQQTVEIIKTPDIYVMKAGNKDVGIGLGQSTSKLREVLGKPDKVFEYYMEVENVTAKIYQYGLDLFYFVDDKLIIYDLYDARVAVGAVNGTSYKVGDKLTVTTKQVAVDPQVPQKTRTETIKSFLNFKVDPIPAERRNIPYNSVIVCLIDKGYGGFEIIFDSNNTIINIFATSYY